MKLEDELALVVLGIIESAGHLRPAARHDHAIIPALRDAIAGRIAYEREQWINFLAWWGDRGHRPHITLTLERNWRKCRDPLCDSVARTLFDLESQHQPLSSPVEAPSAPAPLP